MSDPGYSTWGQPIDPNDQLPLLPPPPPPGAYPPPPPGVYPPPPPAGYPPPPNPYAYGYPQPRTTNGVAIASLVLAFLCAPAGLICGVIALSQLRERPYEDGRGLAIAGIVVSGLAVLATVLAFAMGFALFSGAASNYP